MIAAPPDRQRQTVEALIGLVEGARPASPEGQLVAAIIETRTLAWQYRRIARDVGRDLGWRAEGMAEAVEAALKRFFPTLEEEPADG